MTCIPLRGRSGPQHSHDLTARRCLRRLFRDGRPAPRAPRPVHPWTCFRARRGIHSETGPIPVKFESLPQGVRLAVEAAQEKKAAGITVLDLTAAGAFTDYFVVCTGYSTPQVQAICTEVEAQLYKNLSRSPEHR